MICPYTSSYVCPHGVEYDPGVCCQCVDEEVYK